MWDRLPKKFFLAHCLLFIVFCSLLLTYSRSSYLAFLAGVTWLGISKKSPRLILCCYVATLLFVLILPRPGGEGVRLERTQSSINRLQANRKILDIVKDKPLFGVGFNLLRYEQRDRGFLGEDWLRSHAGAGADNSFLFVLATTGIVGLVAYLWLLKSMFQFIQSLKLFVYPVSASWRIYGALSSSLVAVIVHSQFNNSLFYPWVILWLWLLWGSFSTKGYKSPSPS